MTWYDEWFNDDYVNLYAHRNEEEASTAVDCIVNTLQLKHSQNIVDLGCGAGRHSLAFAKRGHRVLGIDLSQTLLAQAQASAKGLNLPVDFKHGGWSDPLEQPYDLALSLFTSFGYGKDDAENFRVLQTVSDTLIPGGHYVLDTLHPTQVRRDLKAYEEHLVAGKRVHIHKRIEGDTVVKTIEFPHKTYEERVVLYSKEKILKALNSHGLFPLHIFENWQAQPWREAGERQIFFCQQQSTH